MIYEEQSCSICGKPAYYGVTDSRNMVTYNLCPEHIKYTTDKIEKELKKQAYGK